jgi:hypothetical protein
MSEPQRHIEPDPLIDEIRQIRAKLDRQYGDDWAGYAQHLRDAARNFREKAPDSKTISANDARPR